MKLTWFDANSWLVEAANMRILVDPWLIGDLVFGNTSWLVRGYRPDAITPPGNIDLILLSQGLADHAHPETLDALDKSIPVIASPDGASVAQSHGYTTVTAVDHGGTIYLGPLGDGLGETSADTATLKLQTFIGAPVGVTKKENAYVLTFLETGNSLYYEPHGYPDADHLKALGAVDVVITPMADITLMGIAPVVNGKRVAPKLAELLTPQVMLPTAEAGSAQYDGLMAGAIKSSGSAEDVRSQLRQKGLDTRVINPKPRETIQLDLKAAAPISS
ncbi:MAG: MBL fold metallo-hydrolase [Cyanobacteria bacterium J06581_3]